MANKLGTVNNIIAAYRLADLEGVKIVEVKMSDIGLLISKVGELEEQCKHYSKVIVNKNIEISKCVAENIDRAPKLGYYLDKRS